LSGESINLEAPTFKDLEAVEGNERSKGNWERVKYIDKATFPNLSTPLMKAAVNGHVSCVRVLILAGADTKLENAEGKTAKRLVIEKIKEIQKEQKHGFSEKPSLTDDTGYSTPIHTAHQRRDLLEQLESCKKALEMTPEQIRMEDSAEVMSFDSSRKDSHLKMFENQALNLQQELKNLIESSKDTWCDHHATKSKRDAVVDNVVKQFKDLLEKHKTRNPKWYNDGGKYRSAVSEMLSMKENAMAISKLSKATFKEWQDKQTFLRQANRMVSRERLRALRDMLEGGEERRSAALELCKSCGIVTELLEERNEMSETPLIREVCLVR
jgi:hypothetical protein